jgi:glyoxylase-like metal-dependent hydrolase (beta-lactamase superfamily II)
MSKRHDLTGIPSQPCSPAGSRHPATPVGSDLGATSIEPAHRFQHEDTQVVVLGDGHFFRSSDVVAPDAAAARLTDVEERLGGLAGSVATCVNVPVLRRGDELIVVDVGGGGRFQPTEGRLLANVLAAGLDPLAVTRVVLTHAHPDHVWGTTHPNGRLRFPNAAYYVSEVEWDFWFRPDFASTMPAALLPYAAGAKHSFDAIRDRVVMLRPGHEVVPGLQALGTPGHTPGHLSFLLHGREPLIITGDALADEFVSIEHPASRFGNDTDADAAIRTRLRLLNYLATSRNKLLAAHFTYPGTGAVERSGNSFRFTAID